MTKENKPFEVTVEFEVIDFHIWAKNKREAKKKALARLRRMNPVKLIKTDWHTRRKNGLDVEEM